MSHSGWVHTSINLNKVEMNNICGWLVAPNKISYTFGTQDYLSYKSSLFRKKKIKFPSVKTQILFYLIIVLRHDLLWFRMYEIG